VPVLVSFLTRGTDDDLRRAACDALGDLADPTATAALAQVVRIEKMNGVGSYAIKALGQIGGSEAVAVLLSTLAQCTDQETQDRIAIAKACGTTGDLSVAPALLGLLDNDDQRVVAAATEVLGDLGATNAVAKLILLASEGSKEVRTAAARALGQIGDRQALPVLLEMLKRERNTEARTKAAEALGIMSDTNAIPGLRESLADPQEEVRTEVVCSLGHLGDPNSVNSVIAVLKGPPANVQLDASYFLVEIGGAAGISALTANLHDANPDARLGAAFALAMMGQTNALDTLQDFMDHTVPFCRFAAVISLAQSKSPAAAELLKLKTVDRVDAVARVASAAIGGNLTDAMIDAISHKDVMVRRGAVFTFIFFNEPAAIPALRKACLDRDPEVRDSARWAVRRLERLNHIPVRP
jgi:HEAT repeat protein